MQSLVVKHIHLHLEMYGRFILIGDGTVKRTTDDFHALLEFGTGFTARQYMLVGGHDDESMKLHFGLSRVWEETIVVSATKVPITTPIPGASIPLLPLCDTRKNKKTIMCSTKTRVVNLDRRPRRWGEITRTLTRAGFQPNDFERFADIHRDTSNCSSILFVNIVPS